MSFIKIEIIHAMEIDRPASFYSAYGYSSSRGPREALATNYTYGGVFLYPAFYKITLQKGLLGGGRVNFLEYFHEFLGLGHKRNFGKTLGQSRCFGIIIDYFRPFYDFVKFKKSGIFTIGQIWQLFLKNILFIGL